METEVEEHEMPHVLEGGAAGPGVIPVQHEISGLDVAEESARNAGAQIREIRGPTAVLIDGEESPLAARESNEAAAHREIEHERFLTEDVFSGAQRVGDDGGPDFWMRGDV